jgi:hypothetical protein
VAAVAGVAAGTTARRVGAPTSPDGNSSRRETASVAGSRSWPPALATRRAV